jgi:predicted Zn finger-like uncharacterized protein
MNAENDLVAKCPKCSSVFRLAPQHLQAAKGWVQCGMCGNVFHSGIKLAEQVTAPVQPAPPPSPAPQAAPAPAMETPPAEPMAAAPPPVAEKEPTVGTEAAAAGLSGLAQRMADEQGVPSVFGPKLESIILVDPNLPQADDDYGPMPTFDNKPEAPKPEMPAAPSHAPAPSTPAGISARQSTATSTGWIPRRAPPPSTSARPEKKRSKLGWLWMLLALILLLALAAQVAYYMRDKLAANHPEIRPFMEAVCEDLGCSVNLPRDTRQVLILGSDLQTENGGNLNLEITLANRASYPMAWPVLELTLTDVEDQPLARRMFAPSEYLPSSSLEAKGIPARTETPFNLQLQSKSIKAAGYRLRMFY